MNPTLIRTYIRQRLSSPMRVGLLLILVVFPLGAVALSHSLVGLTGLASFYGLLFAAGAVGQDVSSGTLQLLLARPVTRPEYVTSRWVAAGLAGTCCYVVIVALGSLVVIASGSPPEAMAVLRMVVEGATAAFGSAAVLVMLSTLLDGLGDAAAMIAIAVMLQTTAAIATWQNWQLVGQIVAHLQSSLTPSVSLAWTTMHLPPPWLELVSWASTITLALTIAILRLNRRELSYAASS